MKRYVATALIAACCMALPAGAAQSTPPTTDLYGEPHYELVGKLVYSYQRLLNMPMPPELGARFARVTAEYNAIMQEHGDVPDARLDAALREVQAMSKEIAVLKKGNTK